eukprot:gnl/TRDRNA2_/TRDRNA2_84269_c0_seq1.p1 gnl/TRDRNA2_/TRDRNA2_84269_c0~~gnl/TRDRNA2_/TRDRNA2_84269_c0_seq1.p1  ORF type:complete len:508 (-),score=156.72 gnl/TRDRNA2_/TRDRNA2_84269_c0_seq1:231-1754(-)
MPPKTSGEAKIAPASFNSRQALQLKPVLFEESWQKIPFETYEGMTQQQFQDSIAPFQRHGAKVPTTVPKGWRRVEGVGVGKHFYVHMETGTITRYPREIYHVKKECWIDQNGAKVKVEDLNLDPYERAIIMEKAKPLYVEPKAGGAVEETKVMPKKKKEAAKEAAPIEDKPAEEKKEEVAAPAAEAPAIAAEPALPALPVALLFPGQGSQYVKMLEGVKDMPKVKELLDKSKDILGYDLLELCLKGPESKLEETEFCQPAMYVAGCAAVEKLRAEQGDERVDRCQALAGLSLGEYTALHIAGVFDFETGLKLVQLRGKEMQKAAKASEQSMLSVAGLEFDVLDKLCKDCCQAGEVCKIANFLFPAGFTCAGNKASIQKLMAKAKETEGVLQAKTLKTSGGFHTDLMKPAKDELVKYLKSIEGSMKGPRCDVYMNVTAKKITPATKPSEIIDMLGDQLINCVQWEPSMKAMIKDGVTEFYECGPMKQLTAMMKRIDPAVHKNMKLITV